MNRTNEDALRAAFTTAGQDHAVARLDALEGPVRAALLEQMARIDLKLTADLHQLAGAEPAGTAGRAFDPPEVFPLRRNAEQDAMAAAAEAEGERLLREGRVGYVLVAGGQASRLGYDAPKGAFPVGPVTDRSLFEIHARRLRRAREKYGCATPWYVMTSPANDAQTKTLFRENDFYGLPPADIFFFSQDMLPALGEDGRILFSAADSVFLAPNGHGGVLLGLASAGALDDMRTRGIEELSYFQVDNPLVRPADPLFLGLHRRAAAGMSSKVVGKRDAGEKVGVLGRIDGELGCIEYSDLPADLREARDPDGELRFRAGNIAVHVLSVDFLAEVTQGDLSLPWHVAHKKMRVVDGAGQPASEMGYKFETFVFDALGRAKNSVTLEVERALEFSPVKNATGEDSPATTRRDLCALYAGWAGAAGLDLPEPDAEGNRPVEVDPLLAETEEEFVAQKERKRHVVEGGHLYD